MPSGIVATNDMMPVLHTHAQVMQVTKKVAVELFTEKREVDHMDLIMNNALALALNSKSSECVQVVLDATANNKVSGAGGC